MPLTIDAEIETLLRCTKTVAIVGASNRPDRASNGVMAAAQAHGYRVFPVNPSLADQTIHGERVLSNLANIGERVDMVDIFRNSEAAGDAVDQAIAIGAKSVWMQLGVVNLAAAKRAEAAGLQVVMDHCLKIELARLEIAPLRT